MYQPRLCKDCCFLSAKSRDTNKNTNTQSGHVRFTPDCVAKLFCRPKWAILIQGRMQTRNIDSRRRSIGFYYCAIAAQQRVLQHNPPKSGHSKRRTLGP
jgi:hypothetical protein